MMLACLLVALWLLCGAALRSRFAVFDRIYIPPSVIAGFVGLLVIQTLGRGESTVAVSLAAASNALRDWPATLIAVVFAGMLLPRAIVPWKQSIRAAGREVLMVWIIVLGQTAIGLLATWLIIQPLYDVPASFAMLIETGFAGGHGTANAMGQVFKSPQVGFDEGLDLGLMMATVGLVYGTVSGIVWINLAARWGWISRQANPPDPEIDPALHQLQVREQRPSSIPAHPAPADKARSEFSRGIDPLLIQAIWLALAMAIGLALQSAVFYATQTADLASSPATSAAEPSDAGTAEEMIEPAVSYQGVLGGFPLFIYTLFGGWIVRKTLKLLDLGELIHEPSISRWTSMAMDLLVVAAIATLNLAAVVKLLIPFSILAICGMVWAAICLLILSRRILPGAHWFQLGLINYGMSTGVTATGFVLLRIVDPELKTEAAKEYAIAAPFSAPFIGGGMLTITLPLLVLERVPIGISAAVLTLVVSALVAIGWRMRDQG